MIGLYIHVPFCTSKCGYCDFYSLTDNLKVDAYTKAVLASLESKPYDDEVDTIYFGGGTPNLLGVENLAATVAKAREVFSVTDNAEISLEANPESATPEVLKSLRDAGFNRISFGVQSSDDNELKALGRQHTSYQAKEAIIAAHNAGFEHISADLMLGIPHQTQETLIKSVDYFTALPLDHISAYILKIEQETPFHTQRMSRFCVSDEEVADFYLSAVKHLEAAGFMQYEISNFSKAGGQSLHNLKYWNAETYLGIGPSAHSFINGKRFAFHSDLDDFISSNGNWELTEQSGTGGDFYEYAMLKLRLRPGLDLNVVKTLYPEAPIDQLLERAKLIENEGLAILDDMTISFTAEGFLVSNFLIAELLF